MRRRMEKTRLYRSERELTAEDAREDMNDDD